MDLGALIDGNCRTLTDLPYEAVEQILSWKGISHVDICHVSEVCHKLHEVANSRRLWYIKFKQAWGSLCKLYDNHGVDWKEDYQQRYKYGLRMREMVAAMCDGASFPHLIDNSFYKFKESSKEHRFGSHFMLDELESILYDGERYSNLTTKYYCSKLLHFARQYHLKKIFQDFLSQHNSCHQPLEIGACLISQFCQSAQRINVEDISNQLDDIAVHVKEAIRQSCPKHPVLLKDIIPATTVLSESLWSPSDCKIILTCLNATFYHSLEYECIREEEGFSSDQILIDKVLNGKTGVPIVIGIIYTSVAHRLGVLCELCEPGCTALKWLEHPSLDEGNRYTFIDITKCGKFITPAEFSANMDVRAYDATGFPVKLPSQVFKYMIKNLTHFGGRDLNHLDERLLYESSALELGLILSPNDKEKMLMLVQLYLQMDIRLFEAKELLKKVTMGDPHSDYRVGRMHVELETRMKFLFLQQGKELKPPKTKLRENCPTVSFAVGMIMRHKKYDYVCVIYGWDSVCRASDHWIQQMRVFELRSKSNQPFYNVLVEDCTQRYAAQENLEICDSPKFIEHPDIGRFFDEFQHTHFVPNKMVNEEYPQDASARETILRNFYSWDSTTPPLDV